jgi:hypothetical protein
MFWLIGVLFVLGAACGAAIRLMIFIGVLVAATLISLAAAAAAGAGAMVLIAILTLVTLQIGYVAGLVLRAMFRSQSTEPARTLHGKPGLPAPLGGKRR